MLEMRHSVALACALFACASCVEKPKTLHSELGSTIEPVTADLRGHHRPKDEVESFVDKMRDWFGVDLRPKRDGKEES